MIIGDSVHATELSEVQLLSQPHMQSFGSSVAVSPMPNPTAPTAKFTTRCVGETRSEIHARSLFFASVQSSVVTAPPKREPTWVAVPPNTIITYGPVGGRVVTTVIGKLDSCARTPSVTSWISWLRLARLVW